MRDFVHLHTHTEFSLLDGLSKPKQLAEYAKELGMSALAITDHGVMYGVVDFYEACHDAHIKPIIGMETYITPGHRAERSREAKPYHLVLLAQNQQGYQNLLKLASIAQLEGFYYKARIDKEVLEKHSEGLIVLSACVQGEVAQHLYRNQDNKAREAALWYKNLFPDRFYIELQTHVLPEFDETYRKLVDLARELDIPLVATNDIHYAKPDQAEAHDVLLCIQTSKTVNEPNRMRMTDDSYYMRSPEEMWALYEHIPEALENTVKIAEQCNVEIEFAPPYHLPKFPVPEGKGTSQEYLLELCLEGMKMRYGDDATREDYVERLNYELGIIHEMGFDDYFLIVWDLCIAAEEMDIWWNVRGSGAGSVVAYTLTITNVDPFKNRLMFERFLNPGRISMPDIDLDYPDDRRAELIAYTKERYGEDYVSAIITFGTLGARAAIRDVGRALDIPLADVDAVARLIPATGKGVTIAKSLKTVPELEELRKSTSYIDRLLKMAQQVEGVTRHASTHAAGILVSDLPLVEYLPLNRPTKGDGDDSPVDRVSQWPMEVVDHLGMLKVDFLGLRTLTHMRKACEWVEKEHGRKLDLYTIPYERVPDDPEKDADVLKLYELLSTGETTGVFQVEGAGMRRTLRDLRPEQFQHIIAVVALYRPGPMDNIPTYVSRMHDEEEVQYHHPILADILDDTYGIIVYQEQIMQIAVAMADYNPGEADMIRKAVAKKKLDMMEMHKKMFSEGCIKKGISEEVANKVWDDIEFFANYGFNRAHATDYAVITAQTAYLKAHYLIEFMTALMTTERHNTEKLGFLVSDARRTGLTVKGPNINHSDVEFTIEHDNDDGRFIRVGLGGIKNVSDEAMRILVEERHKNGPFETLDELADRVDMRKLNRKAVECLIYAGAMDDFGSRPKLLTIINALISQSAQTHSARDVGQMGLFDGMTDMGATLTLPSFAPPIPDRKLLSQEKELLGTYMSKHPLTEQEKELLQQSLITTTIDRLELESNGKQVTVLAMIQRVKKITTKKSQKMMAFVTLEGASGVYEAIVFPKSYERFHELLTAERVLVVNGKLDSKQDSDDRSLLVNWMKEPHQMIRPVDNGGGYGNGGYGGGYSNDSYSYQGGYAGDPSENGNYMYPDDNGAIADFNFPPDDKGQLNDFDFGNAYGANSAQEEPVSPVDKKADTPASNHEAIENVAPVNTLNTNSEPDNGKDHNTLEAAATNSVTEENDDVDAAPFEAEPKRPPATLYITLRRSGDNSRDLSRLERLHDLLIGQTGGDQFVIVFKSKEQRSLEFSFPNEFTRDSVSLRQKIESLIGQGNIEVVHPGMPAPWQAAD